MEKAAIRIADRGDMRSVLSLVRELALFEREPNAVVLTEQDLIRDGFGPNPLFRCWVAEMDGKVVGMALVYPRYSTWKGQVLHLEDLIVTKEARGSGLGTALLNEVVKYGKEQGVRRISWEVLDWNERAIKFYELKGARVMRDWDVVQLDEKGIDDYLKNV